MATLTRRSFLGTSLLGTSLALCAGSAPASAEAVILTVTGEMKNGRSRFTLSDLRKIGTETITTACPWYDGRPVFEGVPLAALLDFVAARGDTMTIAALNDYVVDVPVADAREHRPILAFQCNGVVMSVRDKGPLFLIYPYDSDLALRSDVYYARSVWQISSIEIR